MSTTSVRPQQPIGDGNSSAGSNADQIDGQPDAVIGYSFEIRSQTPAGRLGTDAPPTMNVDPAVEVGKFFGRFERPAEFALFGRHEPLVASVEGGFDGVGVLDVDPQHVGNQPADETGICLSRLLQAPLFTPSLTPSRRASRSDSNFWRLIAGPTGARLRGARAGRRWRRSACRASAAASLVCGIQASACRSAMFGRRASSILPSLSYFGRPGKACGRSGRRLHDVAPLAEPVAAGRCCFFVQCSIAPSRLPTPALRGASGPARPPCAGRLRWLMAGQASTARRGRRACRLLDRILGRLQLGRERAVNRWVQCRQGGR